MMEFDTVLRSIFYFGVIVNVNDPLELGRAQIRIFGIHNDDATELSNDDLPWSLISIPTTFHGVPGTSGNPAVLPGAIVYGAFMDGTAQQMYLAMGIVPGQQAIRLPGAFGTYTNSKFEKPKVAKPVLDSTSADYKAKDKIVADIVTKLSNGESVSSLISKIFEFISPAMTGNESDDYNVDLTKNTKESRFGEPDVSSLSRNSDSTSRTKVMQAKKEQVTVESADGKSWTEPKTAFAPQYPFNKVEETVSGHTIEKDDTPGAERLSVFHRVGTFIEIHPDGTLVYKNPANNYHIIAKDENISIGGNCNITVSGNVNLYVIGNVEEKVDGNVKQTIKGNVTSDISGTGTYHVKGAIKLTTDASIEYTAQSITFNIKNAITFNAADINYKASNTLSMNANNINSIATSTNTVQGQTTNVLGNNLINIG